MKSYIKKTVSYMTLLASLLACTHTFANDTCTYPTCRYWTFTKGPTAEMDPSIFYTLVGDDYTAGCKLLDGTYKGRYLVKLPTKIGIDNFTLTDTGGFPSGGVCLSANTDPTMIAAISGYDTSITDFDNADLKIYINVKSATGTEYVVTYTKNPAYFDCSAQGKTISPARDPSITPGAFTTTCLGL